MTEYRPVLERVRSSFPDPEMPFEGILRRRDKRQRRRRIAAGVVGIAVFVAAVWIVTSVSSLDRSEKSVVPAGTGPAVTGPTVPYPQWGGFGLPPEGAVRSPQETGKLIAEFPGIGCCPTGWLVVYADGRVI
jgi:hypothetical protein